MDPVNDPTVHFDSGAKSSGAPRTEDGHGAGLGENPRSTATGYVLRKKVAEGGHGEVWEAVQGSLNRIVAIKRIRTKHARSGETEKLRAFEQLFRQEAVVTAFLDHPSIVPIYDLGADRDGEPLLALKLIEGKPWPKLIRDDRRKLPAREFLAKHLPVLASVARAVAFAHSRGIIHRDLKTSQVIVGDFGQVYLTDWGLAAVFDRSLAAQIMDDEPRPPTILECPNPAGTPAFMAPEQTDLDGRGLGPWTDVYLLGAMLYEILTGTPPHQGSRREQFDSAHNARFAPPAERAPGATVPEDLARICSQAMAPAPRDRFPTATEFANAVEQYQAGISRRDESMNLLRAAAGKLEQEKLSYRELSGCEDTLSRALALWTDNGEARNALDRVHERFATDALAAGDLALAELHARLLGDGSGREKHLAAIDEARRRRERFVRQRRFALVSCFVLICAAGALGSYMINHRARARERKQELQTRESTRKVEEQRAAEAAAFAETEARERQQIRELYDAEARLGQSLLLPEWGSFQPVTLAVTPLDRNTWLSFQDKQAEALETSLTAAIAERARLESGNTNLAPPPKELLRNASRFLFVRGILRGDLSGAIAYGRQAVARAPGEYFPRAWLARALFAGGQFDESKAQLEEAWRVARMESGMFGTAQITLSLISESLAAKWADVMPGKADILIEPRAGGRNTHLYRETSGIWANTDSPQEFARSVAPGVTRGAAFGSRCVRFSGNTSPGQNPKSALPGHARYSPRLSSARKLHVYVTWPTAGNAAPVVYTVHHAEGETSFALVQDGWGALGRSNAHHWIPLGAYSFRPGDDQFLELSVERGVMQFEDMWNGQANADAVLFATEPLTTGTLAPPLFDPAILPSPAGSGDMIQWKVSIGDAMPEARKSGKPIFAVVSASGSRATAWLDANVFNDSLIAAAIVANFVPVRMSRPETGDFAARYLETPNGTALVFSGDGSLLDSIPVTDTLTTRALLQQIGRVTRKVAGGNR